ncbi:MAG: glycosyltransferase [Bryobacteraceae bacterium]|nr:glycosyltransferase [Bryobacteraceae bacterium]
MKVVHVLPFDGVGGTEIGQLRVIEALRRWGVENRVVCFAASGPLRELLRERQVPFEVHAPPDPSFRRGARFAWDSWAWSRTLRREPFDVMHCADLLAAYHVSLAGRLAGRPVICHIRSRRHDVSRRDQFFLRPVNHFAFVSEATRASFALPVPSGRATVVYDGLAVGTPLTIAERRSANEALKAELGLEEETRLIGMFGRIAPVKDFATLIQAAALLIPQHREVRFVLVGQAAAGDWEFEQEVHRLISGLGLERYFLFTGFRSEVMRLMNAVDIVVLSTHSEGMPLVLLEAMAAGRPVVATAVDGIPEIVAEGRTGWLVPPGDAPALAERLGDLVRNPERAAQWGEAGRQRVEQQFSVNAFEHGLRDLYRKVVPAFAG